MKWALILFALICCCLSRETMLTGKVLVDAASTKTQELVKHIPNSYCIVAVSDIQMTNFSGFVLRTSVERKSIDERTDRLTVRASVETPLLAIYQLSLSYLILTKLPFYEIASFNVSATEGASSNKWASLNKLRSPESGGIRPYFTINGFSNVLLSGCLDIRASPNDYVYDLNFHVYCSGRKLSGWLSIDIILANEDVFTVKECPHSRVDFSWRRERDWHFEKQPDVEYFFGTERVYYDNTGIAVDTTLNRLTLNGRFDVLAIAVDNNCMAQKFLEHSKNDSNAEA